MTQYKSFVFPDVPPDINEHLIRDDKKMVIVGVIGKSAFPDCNKMAGFHVLDVPPSLVDGLCEEGKITFYYHKSDQFLFVHFETTYDNYCMKKLFEQAAKKENFQFFVFNSTVRNRFARMLLFATTVCHIIILVETSINFDASYLSLFKSLKSIREKHVLKFLPKFVKNSNAGSFLGKDARLCSPRFIFFFENLPDSFGPNDEFLSKLEFEVEDNIYKMLRSEFIITNNSSISLFSIPENKRFVYYNTDKGLREDPLYLSIDVLNGELEKFSKKESVDSDLENLRPYKGFGKQLMEYDDPDLELNFQENERNFLSLLKEYVTEALEIGFDDSMSKFKGKSHFVIPSVKAWFDTFKLLHKIFIENPDNPNFEANDPDYKSYLENFDKLMDIDEEFFSKCCEFGLNQAIALYNNPMMTHYGKEYHNGLVEEAVKLYMKYARGPYSSINEQKLREMCEETWKSGRQQCEVLSLRRNPCVMAKHVVKDASEHSSRVVFVSACNCGRTQGRREDPYTLKQANYEFYQILANNCISCHKLEKTKFPIFEPSTNDYKAAQLIAKFDKLSIMVEPETEEQISELSHPLTASMGSQTNLSLLSLHNLDKMISQSSEESYNELVITLNESTDEHEKSVVNQPSTTEYLPGMVHTESPLGLLPQFPSWSLVCVGPSSVYSHSTGLLEHFQSGFLSGANFLLPWDVHVRLEHSASWAASYEKARYRKKGQVFILKIFVGCEYECPRGHRFIMSSPEKILHGGSGIIRDSGSKVVFNEMPLYFPCPCRNTKPMVAQLMRVHVVTPKAPVNVILDPKVRTGDRDYIFTMGLAVPPKLSQSTYWILRFPYIYEGDNGPIPAPLEVSASNAMSHGSLLAGMYGVTETEIEN